MPACRKKSGRRMSRKQILAGLAMVMILAGGLWTRLADETHSPILQTIPLGGIPAALAVDGRTRRVFVISAYGGESRLLDARTGATLRTLPVVGAAVAVDEQSGRVFVTGPAGVTMLDATSGRVLRVTGIAVAPGSVAVDAPAGHVFVANPANNTVTMLDAATGAVLHGTAVVLTPLSVLVDPRTHRAYASSDSPLVAVIDTRSGSVLGATAMRGLPNPAVMDGATGRTFIADPQGTSVSVLDTTSGAALRTVTVGSFPVAVTADAATGRAFVLARSTANPIKSVGPVPVDLEFGLNGTTNPTAPGGVYILDGYSGAILHRLPAGLSPIALAFDRYSGHLFVANGFGVQITRDPWNWLPSWLRHRLPFLPPPGPHITIVPPHVTILAVGG